MIPRPGETPGEWWGNTGWEPARIAAAQAGGYPAEFDLPTYFLHDVPADVAAAGEACSGSEGQGQGTAAPSSPASARRTGPTGRTATRSARSSRATSTTIHPMRWYRSRRAGPGLAVLRRGPERQRSGGVARRRPAGPRRGHEPERERAGLRGAGAGPGRAPRAQRPAGHNLPRGQQGPGDRPYTGHGILRYCERGDLGCPSRPGTGDTADLRLSPRVLTGCQRPHDNSRSARRTVLPGGDPSLLTGGERGDDRAGRWQLKVRLLPGGAAVR